SDKAILDSLKSLLDRFDSTRIEVEGHASSDGSSALNQKLSEERAASVKAYLVDKGIAESRIETIGYGETRLMGDNNTVNGRAMSRRANINRRASFSMN
ncbi:MAG: OmpA family protein, partial [Flavobacteriaceae bacterium]